MARLRKKKTGDISLDLTSFSDIANLLIIFFILTTSLARPFGRQIEMPSSAKPEEQQQNDSTPTVRITGDRLIFSTGENNEKEISMNELRSELWARKFAEQPKNKRSVVVETSPEVSYDRYYQVVTAVAAAGGVIAILEE